MSKNNEPPIKGETFTAEDMVGFAQYCENYVRPTDKDAYICVQFDEPDEKFIPKESLVYWWLTNVRNKENKEG